MKFKPLNLIKLLGLFAPFILQSCSPEIGVWKDDQIKSGQRDEMHELNAAVFKAVAENNDKKFGNYLSADMLQDYYRNKLFASVLGVTRKDSFKLATEFYIMNKYTGADTIKAGSGKERYSMIYQGDPQEMYIATFLPQKKTPNQYMITFYYGHYNYGWKIKDIDVAPYTLNSKTAPQIYEKAKQAYASKDLFAAANIMQLAQSCSRPNLTWKYDCEEEMYEFAARVLQEANTGYKFPMEVASVSSHPLLLRIYNNTYDNGTFPNICYITKLNLKDAAALERENAEIRKNINKLLPGIEKHTDYVVYSVYNKIPDSHAVLEHYDIKVKGL